MLILHVWLLPYTLAIIAILFYYHDEKKIKNWKKLTLYLNDSSIVLKVLRLQQQTLKSNPDLSHCIFIKNFNLLLEKNKKSKVVQRITKVT